MTALALPPPHIDIDALPYIDMQYNDPAVRKQVDSLIQEEKKSFKPRDDYLARWPLQEPEFEVFPMLSLMIVRLLSLRHLLV